MSDIQKIDSETAAHNIATIFSELYVKSLNDTRILSSVDSEVSTAARKAAELYAIAYDEAFGYFSAQNSAD